MTPARSPVTELFAWSRAAIWAAAIFAFVVFEPNRHPHAARWDDPRLTHDLGYAIDVWARWDSVWFLRIAEHGYTAVAGTASAFYPLFYVEGLQAASIFYVSQAFGLKGSNTYFAGTAEAGASAIGRGLANASTVR